MSRIWVYYFILMQIEFVFAQQYSQGATFNDPFLTCKNNGCHNGGICVGDTCTCRLGYTGILCQSEILECLSQPCRNNGICNDRIGSFSCTCLAGFAGTLCEITLSQSTTQTTSLCTPSCVNGTCMHDVFGAVCICNNGYTGNDCSVPLIDPSITNSCPENYYGPQCQKFCKEFDDCANGHFYCDPKTGMKICRSGWSGSNCTNRDIPNYIDKQCPPGLSCKNDGHCFNNSCCCRAGFTGRYCETEQLKCKDKPCRPECTCHQLSNGHHCHCPSTIGTTWKATPTLTKIQSTSQSVKLLSTTSTKRSTSKFTTPTRQVGFCVETKCTLDKKCVNATGIGTCYCLDEGKAYFCPFLQFTSKSRTTNALPMSSTPINLSTITTTITTPRTNSPTTTTTTHTTPTTTQTTTNEPTTVSTITKTQEPSTQKTTIPITKSSSKSIATTPYSFSTITRQVGMCIVTLCDKDKKCINATGDGLCYCLDGTAFFCPFVDNEKTLPHVFTSTTKTATPSTITTPITSTNSPTTSPSTQTTTQTTRPTTPTTTLVTTPTTIPASITQTTRPTTTPTTTLATTATTTPATTTQTTTPTTNTPTTTPANTTPTTTQTTTPATTTPTTISATTTPITIPATTTQTTRRTTTPTTTLPTTSTTTPATTTPTTTLTTTITASTPTKIPITNPKLNTLTTLKPISSTPYKFSTITRQVGLCNETTCDKTGKCVGAAGEGLCYCLETKAYFCPYVNTIATSLSTTLKTIKITDQSTTEQTTSKSTIKKTTTSITTVSTRPRTIKKTTTQRTTKKTTPETTMTRQTTTPSTVRKTTHPSTTSTTSQTPSQTTDAMTSIGTDQNSSPTKGTTSIDNAETTTITTQGTTKENIIPEYKVYLNGTIKPKEIPLLQQYLHNAANKTDKDCEPNITDINTETMIDKSLQQKALMVTFHADDCFNGTDPNTFKHFLSNLGKELKNKPFSHIKGPVNPLNIDSFVSLNDALYDLNLYGYVYQNNLQDIKDKIKQTWNAKRAAAKDVDILIVSSKQMIGGYGSRVTRIQFLASSRGTLILPKNNPAPSPIRLNYLLGSVYLEENIYPLYDYSQGIRIQINKTVEDIKLSDIKTELRDNLKGTKKCTKNCNWLDVLMAPLEETSKKELTDVVYFPMLNGTVMDVQDTRYSCDGGCLSPPRRQYIDVIGHIKLKDMETVRHALSLNNMAARKTRRVSNLSMVKQRYLSSVGSVTRVWYSEIFKDNKMTWPTPNLAGRLDSIENELSALNRSIFMGKSNRHVYLDLKGLVSKNKDVEILHGIVDAWENFNSIGHMGGIHVTIDSRNWDTNYVSENTSEDVTRIRYIFSVLGTDFTNTAIQEPDQDTFSKSKSFTTCNCIARQVREIQVTGQLSLLDKNKIKNILKLIWNSENKGLGVSIEIKLKNILMGYYTVEGKPAAILQYYVSPTMNGKYVDEDDLEIPSYNKVKIQFQTNIPGIEVVNNILPHTTFSASTTELPLYVKKKEEKLENWMIIVAIIAALLVLIILIILAAVLYRRYRHFASRTLKQSPSEMNGFDKEHFSEQPDFDSPNYSISESDYGVGEKKSTYLVNS